ncbi:MAG: hypothetical protein E2O64_02775 [Gammaproteobacteria bacterium]|nr:MAG: hypothetical protein E2O64_02775 [Gammaproteobacteria bacterium]
MTLEEKLAAANRENVRRVKRLALVAGLFGFGMGVFALASSWDPAWLERNSVPSGPADLSPANKPALGNISEPIQPNPTVDQAALTPGPTVEPDRAVKPELKPEFKPEIKPDEAEPGSERFDCTTNDPTGQACKRARALFKEELKAFEADLEPRLKAGSVHQWAADVHNKIFELKAAALQAFGAGDYSSALSRVRAATIETLRILKVRDANFAAHLKAAVSAFDTNRYERARAEIDRALLMRPDHPTAQEYQARIELMPKVLSYLEAAAKARAENELRSEKAYLEKVIRLDPARRNEKSRLTFLNKKIAEEDFASHLSTGLQAVERRDLGAARTSLTHARAKFPDRPELTVLKKNIEALSRDLSLESALNEANQSVSNDDWDRAYQAFSKANSIDPANATAVEGERIAAEMLAGRRGLDRFLKRPDRLASKTVAAAARQVLEEVRHLTGLSPTLKDSTEKLSKLIEHASRPVEVLVKSDGKTDITVRRIGIVGKTLEKVIKLRPGDYTFEGTRTGYKSKLINFSVPVDGEGIEIRIICDEQI